MLDYENLIRLPDGTEPVRYYKSSTAFHEFSQAFLNVRLTFGVQVGRGLVKNQYTGVGQNCPTNDKLV